MANNSATGGYLVPELPSNTYLIYFFNSMISGVTGLTSSLIRPRWQQNPPAQPNITVDWCSFGITQYKPDANAYIKVDDENVVLQRQEDIEILVSFYGPNCQGYTQVLRDGLEISQNREQLFLNNMAYKGSENALHVPELINDRWFDRVDITLTFSRQIGGPDQNASQIYDVLPLLSAEGEIITETLIIPWVTPTL